MAGVKQTVTVEAGWGRPEDEKFRVRKLVNILSPSIGKVITRQQVQEIIDSGVTVNVTPLSVG